MFHTGTFIFYARQTKCVSAINLLVRSHFLLQFLGKNWRREHLMQSGEFCRGYMVLEWHCFSGEESIYYSVGHCIEEIWHLIGIGFVEKGAFITEWGVALRKIWHFIQVDWHCLCITYITEWGVS